MLASELLIKVFGGFSVRIIAFITTCFVSAVAMCMFTVNVYIADVGKIFNVSQSQLEITITMSMLGSGMALPIGYFIKDLGPTATFFTFGGMNSAAYLFLYIATLKPDFFHRQYWLIQIYSFLIGAATVALLVCGTSVGIQNFCSKHWGKVVGIAEFMILLGQPILSVIYRKFFAPTNDAGGYFMLMTIISCIAWLLGTLFARDYSELVVECNNQNRTDPEYQEIGGPQVEIEPLSGNQEKKGLSILKDIDFHCLCWSNLFCVSVTNCVMFNHAVILNSYNRQHLVTVLLAIGPILNAVTRISFGAMSDYLITVLPRNFYLSLISWMQAILFFLVLIDGNNTILLVTCVMFVYVSNGAYFSVYLVYLSEIFGKKSFSVNFGGILFGQGIFSGILLVLAGFIYDRNVKPGNVTCEGTRCFFYTFLISAILCTIAAVLTTLMIKREFVTRNWVKKQARKPFM